MNEEIETAALLRKETGKVAVQPYDQGDWLDEVSWKPIASPIVVRQLEEKVPSVDIEFEELVHRRDVPEFIESFAERWLKERLDREEHQLSPEKAFAVEKFAEDLVEELGSSVDFTNKDEVKEE